MWTLDYNIQQEWCNLKKYRGTSNVRTGINANHVRLLWKLGQSPEDTSSSGVPLVAVELLIPKKMYGYLEIGPGF